MKNVIRYKTIYTGISDYIPDDINSFTQMNVNEVVNLESELPDIDEILKVHVVPEEKNKKIVRTAVGKSLEGQILTGYKLLTDGYFSVQINYCGDDGLGRVYIVKKNLYFNNATTLDCDINLNSKVISSIYIEDIYAEKLSAKQFLINISFIFTVENY